MGGKSQSSIWEPTTGSEMPLEFQVEKLSSVIGSTSLESRGDVWAMDIHFEVISIQIVLKGRRLNDMI